MRWGGELQQSPTQPSSLNPLIPPQLRRPACRTGEWKPPGALQAEATRPVSSSVFTRSSEHCVTFTAPTPTPQHRRLLNPAANTSRRQEVLTLNWVLKLSSFNSDLKSAEDKKTQPEDESVTTNWRVTNTVQFKGTRWLLVETCFYWNLPGTKLRLLCIQWLVLPYSRRLNLFLIQLLIWLMTGNTASWADG